MLSIINFNTYKIIHKIFRELQLSFIQMKDDKFDIYSSLSDWDKYMKSFHKICNNREDYKYLFHIVLKDENFCSNFNKFMKLDIKHIEDEIKITKSFYLNSYILFLLSIRRS